MNNTAAATGDQTGLLAASSYGTLTGVHLALIALFALVVIAAIVYGARLHHRRRAAEKAVEEHAVEAGVPLVAPEGEAEADTAAPLPSLGADPAEDRAPQVDRPLPDEPIAADASPYASPAIEAASAPAGDPSPAGGSITQLKGLGPKVATRLAELGVTTVGQVAALSDDEAQALDDQLGPFRGRLARDRWIEQARFLAAGDRAGFEAVFGRL
jgi:predicted flap endonuclease-1-like 5' DNA nuclease